MIEKMQKLTLLLFYTEKKRILRALQNLGIADLEFTQSETPVIQQYRQELAEIKKLLGILEVFSRSDNNSDADILHQPIDLPNDFRNQLKIIREIIAEKEHLENAISELESDKAEASVWGEIPTHTLAKLERHGVRIALFIGSKKFFENYNFAGHCVSVITWKKNTVYFMVVTFHEEIPVIPFLRYQIPARTLSEIDREISYLTEKLNTVRKKIMQLARQMPVIRKAALHAQNRQQFEVAKHSLEANESQKVFQISGYFPVKNKERILHFLERHALAYEITEPPGTENVPVLLKNGFFSRLFEPVTRIYSIPAYRELDPTPLFAPFFTLFFGFCLGDVGYGILLMLISLLLYFRPSMKSISILGLVLSAATMGSGFLMNSFFGANLFVMNGSGLFTSENNPGIFAAYTLQGKTTYPAMTLSLLIGCFQIVIAFFLQSINSIYLFGWRYALKSLAMILITVSAFVLSAHSNVLNLGFDRNFVIGPLAVGAWLTLMQPEMAYVLLGVGGILFFLLGNPDLRIWLRPLSGLWDFYQFSTGILGDFLSYIRLFALALAGGLLGNAFNQIAFMVLPTTPAGPEFASPWIIVSVLILIFGHTLNFGLSVLGAFVHSLRLTFVEFYKNMNFKGGGRMYKPFSKASLSA